MLKYNPDWSGAGETVHPIEIPDCYEEKFQLVYREEFPLKVPFTRESWNGREKEIRAGKRREGYVMSLFDKRKKKNENGFLKIDVKPLIDWNEPNGEGCIASDMITKEGWKVGYMFRDEPLENQPDSGWHFFKGDESEEYSNDANNFHVFALNTLCNYDQDIIPYLNLPVGTHLIRTAGGKFIADDGSQPIRFEKQ